MHGGQVERLEVVSGTLKVVIEGREHVLSQGQSIEVPAGAPHTQVPVGDGRGVVRIQVRPAGRTQAFLERLAELCREGKITRMGFPRPVAGAELVLEYGDTGHAAKPSLRVQRAIAGLVVGVAHPMAPYLFVDEWDVAAPPEAVFDALADARSYPRWWRPVYLDVDSAGPVGRRRRGSPAFQGAAPVPPPHAFGDRRARSAAQGDRGCRR